MKKKISVLLCISFILTGIFSLNLFTFAAGWNQDAQVPEIDTDGYYHIATPGHFMWLKDHPTAQCRLVADFTIGTKDVPFMTPFRFNGTLIGYDLETANEAMRTITAYISTANQNAGLFSDTTGVVIMKNISLKGSVMLTEGTSYYTGGLFGQVLPSANGSVIEKCINYATITGTTQVGGLMGRNHTGYPGRVTIKNCKNYGAITSTGGMYAGGIAGVTDAAVSLCVNMGTVSAKTDHAGGIAGWITGKDFSQNYNRGNISAANYAGGLIGKAQNKDLVIQNCYNTGTISSAGAAGIATAPQVSASLIDCYNIGIVSGTNASHIFGNAIAGSYTATNCYYLNDGKSGKAGTIQINADQISISAWNFNQDIWENPNSSYSYLRLKNNSHLSVLGTIDNPFLITDQESFEGIKNNPTAFYRLENKIILTNYVPFAFSGTLTAKNLTQIDLSISAGNEVGLFSKATGTVKIENIKTTGFVTGTDKVGGFFGIMDGASSVTINNCVNDATITATGLYAGGLVGRAYGLDNKLTITNFKNYNTITANQHAGGIGGLLSGKISNCANFGVITASDIRAGGICSWGTGIEIKASFNMGKVTAKGLIGGLIGISQYANNVIENSYNGGTIYSTLSPIDVGGLVGQVFSNTLTATNSYNVGTLNSSNSNKLFGSGAFTGVNSYFIDPAGDLNETDALLTVAAMKNINLGAAFEPGTTDYGFPQIKNNLNPIAIKVYIVTVHQPENGTILPEGTFYHTNLDPLRVFAIADEGYYVESIAVNGGTIPFEEVSMPLTENVTVSAVMNKLPDAEEATIQEEIGETTVSFLIPQFEEGETVETQNGLLTMNKDTLYSVIMASVLEYQGWKIVDYGISLKDKLYSGAPYIKDHKYGVMFYGTVIQPEAVLEGKLYVVYENETTKETITVYGQQNDITLPTL